jgi:integrase
MCYKPLCVCGKFCGNDSVKSTMGQARRKLSAVEIIKLTDPGLHWVSDGLYLSVGDGASRTKSWIFRFMIRDRAREMGLGSFKLVSLAEAREEAWKCRRLVSQGIDPIEARRAKRDDETRQAGDKRTTFRVFAEGYIERHKGAWKNPERLAREYRGALTNHVYPLIGELPIRDVTTQNILEALQPLWFTKTPTATVLQNRLEQIFDDAIVQSKYSEQNPARWKKHLENTLRSPAKFYREKHHVALEYPELPRFMAQLRECDHIGSPCLQFLIITNVRCKEVRGTMWAEIDEDKKLWKIPAVRMKGRREGDDDHYVPLSDAAMEILDRMKKCRINAYIFPGEKDNKSISPPCLPRALGKIRTDITPHGFRRTFRTWAANTNHRQDLVELCLAHTVAAAKVTGVDPRIRKAYLDDDPELRRPIMQDWANFAMSVISSADQTAEIVMAVS